MEAMAKRLKQIAVRLSEPAFLNNKGLSNEVNIHVFCYPPNDEIRVLAFFDELQKATDQPFRLIEKNLYGIFLSICEEKRILSGIPAMEERKGKGYLLEQLQRIASPESFAKKMQYEPHRPGDVLLITGVGKVYPFMRVHNILDNIQHMFSDVPVVMI